MTAKLDEISAQVKTIPGVVDVYSAWRADGNGITTAIYENQAAAEAATPQVQEVWANLADLLVDGPNPEGYENVAHLTA